MELLHACESIVQGQVDLSSWKHKIEGDMAEAEDCTTPWEIHTDDGDGAFIKHERYKDNILTIGCCGYPNVGKSSLMNGLVGKKVTVIILLQFISSTDHDRNNPISHTL